MGKSDPKPKRKAKTTTSQLLLTSKYLHHEPDKVDATTTDTVNVNNDCIMEPSIVSLELPQKKKNAIIRPQLNL